MITLKEAKEKFKDEWLAFLVEEESPEPAGEVLDHDKDKHALHKRLRKKNIKYVYITYSGSYIKPGYEVLF
ncbi:hypothetical protein KAW48_04020 [candidate division WOR-3 bacterium]|nr:hypothetical protein [candidate division WOR-3 bacterium]